MGKLKGFRLVRDSDVLASWDKAEHPSMSTPDAVHRFLKPFAVQEETETCWVLPLDQRVRLITEGPIVVSRGSPLESVMTPSLVFRPAIAVFATKIVVAHNHPGGEAKPSIADDQITNTLRNAGELLQVDLVDHLIIAPKGFYSYARKGKL